MSSSYHAPPAAAAAASSSSHYNRYDDDALDTDEEEEERRLSEQYGEADHDDDDNDNGRNKRRGRAQANTTLTEEDAAAAKEFEEKVRSRAKKARPSLQPAHLKSAKGLLYVRRAFPTLVKKYPASTAATESSSWDPIAARGSSTATKTNTTFLKHKLSTQSQIKNAARYSRSLMSAYREFAHELFPSLAAEDVFLKIEDLGSKKEVKDYLQLMRDEFRKEYLEGIYGVEKTGRLLNELEHGLKVHQMNHLEGEDDNNNYYGDTGGVPPHGSVAPRLGHAIVTNEEDGEDDTIITTSPPVGSSPPTNAMASAIAVNPYSTTSISHIAILNTDFATGDGADKNITANVRGEDEVDDEEAIVLVDDDVDAAEEPVSERLSVAGEVKTSDEGNAGFGNSTESEFCEVGIDERRVHVDVGLAKDDTAEDEVISPTILGGIIQELINVDNNNVENDRTQETLTLLESQFDNSEMDATQDDDRFSQEGVDVKWNKERKDGMDDTFVVGDGLSKIAMEKLARDEEENTADERFSQFTQISGLIFEQDEEASQEEADDENKDMHGNCDQLGQPTQLSMEY